MNSAETVDEQYDILHNFIKKNATLLANECHRLADIACPEWKNLNAFQKKIYKIYFKILDIKNMINSKLKGRI